MHLVSECTSIHLDYTTGTEENTQFLINYNLSDNSKTRPPSEFSKILAGDYNPSPANSKILALCDMSNANYSEQLSHQVSQPNLNYDDSISVYITDLSKKDLDCLNISQEERCLSVSPIQTSPNGNISVDEIVEKDYCKIALMNLVEFKPRKWKLTKKIVHEWHTEMRRVDEEIRKQLKILQNRASKDLEKCRIFPTETETSSLQESIEEVVAPVSVLELTDEIKEVVSIEQKIKEKSKK